MRSSEHNLPDLVVALHGMIDVEVPIPIDSVHGQLCASLEEAPDAPISKAIVTMQGGQKGLIVNSTNLCASTNRAKARLSGQNGRVASSRPPVRAECGKKSKKKHRRRVRHERNKGKKHQHRAKRGSVRP